MIELGELEEKEGNLGIKVFMSKQRGATLLFLPSDEVNKCQENGDWYRIDLTGTSEVSEEYGIWYWDYAYFRHLSQHFVRRCSHPIRCGGFRPKRN